MIKLTLPRNKSGVSSTISPLYLNGEFFCHVLEDVVREEKIPGETAIPAGTYNIIITFSPHFNCQLPLLLGVPNYEGVRIHPGNTDADTKGCLLVGIWNGKDEWISDSRLTFSRLMNAIAGQQVSIEITDAI